MRLIFWFIALLHFGALCQKAMDEAFVCRDFEYYLANLQEWKQVAPHG